MIIVEGPDASGKTTLAKTLGLDYWHFTMESSYDDYLKPLANLELFNAVLDRCPISEYPYSRVMGREFGFSMKEWHNLLLLILVQKPLIVLCTHKPSPSLYSPNQYLPHEKWDLCLELYRQFLSTHHIPYLEYDYASSVTPTALKILHDKHIHDMDWWKPMWEAGYGCIGSSNPKVLLVAERIGPNNTDNLPFQVGPTGYMLSELLSKTGTPLGKFAVTNMVKSYRRDPRPPNQQDMDLLRVEIDHLKPQKIVFMGAVARQGIKVAKEAGIPYVTMVHFGYLNYRKEPVSTLYGPWKEIMGIT